MDLQHLEQKDFITISCQKTCKTIIANDGKLSNSDKSNLKKHLNYFSRKKPILVAACDNKPKSQQLAIAVANYIKQHNRQANIVRNVTPYVSLKSTQPCVNLIKGFLNFKLPNCNDVSNYKKGLLVGYNFGCSNNHNLLQMLKEPNDLLATADSYALID